MTRPPPGERRTRVKVCGLTRRDDALAAADLGADALGFVFAPKSRRRADPEVVARVAEEVPPFVTLVGVFQDQSLDEVRSLVNRCRLHLAQLHGREDLAYARALGCRVLKAVSLEGPEDVASLAAFPGLSGYLLDSGSGGTGRAFDWSWAVEARRFGRIVLAGGLHPGNAAAAVRAVRPWAIDAASGTEAAPGVKDLAKIAALLRAVRRADADVDRPVALDEGMTFPRGAES
ncbi:MAG: phosphoribosylanthranilate isomerase [Deltaproteobacteria bacterium]|nr:phosphoribosylanthranilate isomerase [Deltaproteobacteria bacterium]